VTRVSHLETDVLQGDGGVLVHGRDVLYLLLQAQHLHTFVYVYIVKLPHRSMTFWYLYSINNNSMLANTYRHCKVWSTQLELNT